VGGLRVVRVRLSLVGLMFVLPLAAQLWSILWVQGRSSDEVLVGFVTVE